MAVRCMCACALLLAAAPAGAVVPRGTPAETLTALPAAGVTKPVRVEPALRYGGTSAPWQAFVSAAGGSWEIAWDAATGVPSQIWGSGVAAPAANGRADVAETIARQWLGDHLALLAPGAAVTDFQLASNTTDGEIRSVGFYQFS